MHVVLVTGTPPFAYEITYTGKRLADELYPAVTIREISLSHSTSAYRG